MPSAMLMEFCRPTRQTMVNGTAMMPSRTT